MKITLQTSVLVGKSLGVKREKDPNDAKNAELLRCHLSFADLLVDRETIDELCGRPIGWAQSALFDDQGAPVADLVLELPARELSVTGSLRSREGAAVLKLLQADLTGVRLELSTLGALMSGKLAWDTAGDEAEDVSDLLGRLSMAVWQVTDGGQVDLLRTA